MGTRSACAVAATVVFVILVAIETQLDSGWVRFTGGDRPRSSIVRFGASENQAWTHASLAKLAKGEVMRVSSRQARTLV